MSVKVGTLVIDLTANTASFSSSMEKMEHLSAKTANGVKKSLETIAAAGIAMGAAIATGTAAAIESALDSADSLLKLASAAGTTVEKLTTLNYAAKLSNVSTEQLGVGLEKLSKNAFSAQNGNDALARTFGKLGVSVDDGNGHLKDSGELLSELAPKFATMQDGAGKTALAIALFGKAGAGLIPMLNQYGSEQEKVNSEAKRFGQILSTETATAAGEAHDNLDRLHALAAGFGNTLLVSVMPAVGDLADRLIKLAGAADIPSLGKSFGETVSGGIRKTGDAVEWVAKNAGLLKTALEALVGLQVLKIAIPLLAEMSASNLSAGVGRLLTGLLGLEKAVPVLKTFGTWVTYNTGFLRLLAAEEGVAAAATYGLNAALTALAANPVLMIGGIVLGVGAAVHALVKQNDEARAAAERATSRLHPDFSSVGIPNGNVKSPQVSLGDRLDKMFPLPAPKSKAPDTTGLGTPKKDIVGEEKAKLDLAIAAQREFLANLNATPEKLQEITAAQRADAEVLQLRNQLQSEGNKLSARDEQAIRQRIQTQDALKALNEYGRSLVDGARNADLAAAASNRLTAAQFAGEEATRRATVENEIAAMQAGKTAAEIQAMTAETEKYRASRLKQLETEASNAFARSVAEQADAEELAARQARNLADAQARGEDAVRGAVAANALLALQYRNTGAALTDKTRAQLESIRALSAQTAADQRRGQTDEETRGMHQDLGSRAGLPAAILQGEDAYRRAALAARLYGINQRINEEADGKARVALILQRQAMIDLAQAEFEEADARAALELRSPLQIYQEETAALNRQIAALEKFGGAEAVAGSSATIAAARQESLNRAIDAQITLLTKFGTMRDGVNAFFLSMERSAKSTASIVYDALTSAFDGIAHNLTQLVTGGKTSFGAMFTDIGRQLVESTIKNQMQAGLKKLGGALGIPGLGGNQYDGQSASTALWVQFAGAAGPLSNPLAGIIPSLPGAGGNGSTSGGGAGGFLAGLLGAIFGGGRASGGSVSPSSAYLVGENGPEILYGASGRIASNSETRQVLGGAGMGGNHYYIDARGSKDPHLTEQNVRRALVATHQSAVVTAMQAGDERRRRTL